MPNLNSNNLPLLSFSNLHTFWGIKDYEEEYIAILQEREARRMNFYFQSPQIKHRAKLVEWIKEMALSKNLDNYTIHLAVYILDVFMDNYDIVVERLTLIALTCLLLAIKFEERDCNVLKPNDVKEFLVSKYTILDYNASEIMILKHLEWNLLHPTTVHFIHVYIEFLFSDDEVQNLCNFDSEVALWCDARNIIKNYMDYVMDDINLMQEKPSLVGAAIMASTRSNLGFKNIWSKKLKFITGYNLFQLNSTILRLQNVEQKHISN